MSPVKNPTAPMPAVDDTKVRAAYALNHKQRTTVKRHWHEVATLGGSATLLTGGTLSVMHDPHALLASIACAGVSAVSTGAAVRADVRREIDMTLRATTERMTGPLGRWRCSRWNGGLVGSPRVIKLRHLPEATLGIANWPAPLAKALSDTMHVTYVVDKHHKARGTVVLRRRDVTVADVEKDRSERIITQLFGDDSHLKRQQKGSSELLTVTYSNVLKASDHNYRAQVEHVINTAMPGRWRARWDLLSDQVHFEVRPQLPTKLLRRPPLTDPADKKFFLIPLGEDEDGNISYWNLNSSMPHLLTAGKTGKGKTNLILGVGRELSARKIAVWGADPKRIELQSLAGLPNVQVVTTTPEDMAAMVMCAYNEMELRYKLIEQGKAKKGSFERIVVLIDEYAEFMMRIQSWWARVRIPGPGSPTKCPVLEAFETLIRLCRAAQMNVMVGIQRPDVKYLPGEARDNFDARCSLGPLTSDGSGMMWGSQIGCTTGLARGRAMACANDGEPVEIQTYWTPDPENDDIDDEIRALLDTFAADEIHPKMRISIPNPEQDDKGRELWWDAIQDARLIIDDRPRINHIAEQAAQQAPTRPALHVVTTLDDDPDYGPARLVDLTDVRSGDLYWRDDQWVQVQGAIEDPVEDGMWALSWEDEDGVEGTDLIPDDTRPKIRHLA